MTLVEIVGLAVAGWGVSVALACLLGYHLGRLSRLDHATSPDDIVFDFPITKRVRADEPARTQTTNP